MDVRVNKFLPEGMLERMASPERLDEMMVVVPPKGWWALGTFGLVVGAALFWAVFGRVPIKIEGQGLTVRGGGVYQVTSGTTGQIAEITVSLGQPVGRDDVVALVSRPDLLIPRETLQSELADLEAQFQKSLRESARRFTELRRQLGVLQTRLETLEELARKGAITWATVEEHRQKIERKRKELEDEKQVLAEQENRIQEIKREIKELDEKLTISITTHRAGKVLELKVNPGDSVSPGTPILTLEPLEEDIQAVLYVPAAHGKKIRRERGQEVRLSPSNYRVEEHGYLLADILRISEYPVSPEATENVLGNAHLAEILTGEGSYFEVLVSLRRADTPSGFEWSSGAGPDGDVYTGTLSTASIVVEWRRPISWLFDFLDKLT